MTWETEVDQHVAVHLFDGYVRHPRLITNEAAAQILAGGAELFLGGVYVACFTSRANSSAYPAIARECAREQDPDHCMLAILLRRTAAGERLLEAVRRFSGMELKPRARYHDFQAFSRDVHALLRDVLIAKDKRALARALERAGLTVVPVREPV